MEFKKQFTNKITILKDRIEIQKIKLEKGNPSLHLEEACQLHNGILPLTDSIMKKAIENFENHAAVIQIAFFIPASGSGSRMFDVLYSYLDSDTPTTNEINAIEILIKHTSQFAFFKLLSTTDRNKLIATQINPKSFIRFLLFEEGLNFGSLPKGLIPFHKYPNYVTNPFQEHLIQGAKIAQKNTSYHFTINEKYKDLIANSIQNLEAKKKKKFNCSFSTQNPTTDAISFDSNLNPVKSSSSEFITRPAGHGALLQNLNSINADIIFIRNIDNVQHLSKAKNSIQTRKALAGILLDIRNRIFEILKKSETNHSWNSQLKILSNEYQLNFPAEKISDKNFVLNFLNRPIRICGMVVNQGQPGGGPFWVKDKDGILRKQIVEKSQISSHQAQVDILIQSTHFNPVEIVCSTKDYQNKKFDLKKFTDESLYFIVQKTHNGKSIQYIEEPGLWNGCMNQWLTIFYEIDSFCFSPVKSFLDLLESPHQKI